MDTSISRLRATALPLLLVPAAGGRRRTELRRNHAAGARAGAVADGAAQCAWTARRRCSRRRRTLPDPRLIVGVDNLPVTGAEKFSLTRDFMTMQRIGLMQEVPNRAKREARAAGAEARVQRERALLAAVQLSVQRDAALAWLGVYFAERRIARLSELERENRVLIETLDARIASGQAMPAERTMARQEALALADRRDDAKRDIAKARAALRRWVGERADEAAGGRAAGAGGAARAVARRHAPPCRDRAVPGDAGRGAGRGRRGRCRAAAATGPGSWCTAAGRSTAT